MNTQILFGVAVVPAVVGLVEVCKDLGLPTRAAPAAAVAFGILAALAQIYAGTWPWIQAVVLGVALGLAAAGLYSGDKTVAARATNSTIVPLIVVKSAIPAPAAAPAAPPIAPPIVTTPISPEDPSQRVQEAMPPPAEDGRTVG
jgi:hypothetical protein